MGRGVDALRPVLGLLRRGIVTDDDARELTTLLAPLFGSDAVAIGAIGTTDWAFQEHVPPAWYAAYESLGKEDPSIPVLLPSPPGTWFFCERALDGEDAKRDSAFIERYYSESLYDAAVARLYTPVDDDLTFVLYRARGRRPFGEDEAFLLELLYPHLASGLATRRALGIARADPHAPSVEISFPKGKVETPARTWRFLEARLGPLGRDGRAKIERVVLAATHRFTAANVGGQSQRILPNLRLELAALPPERNESARLRGIFLDESAQVIASIAEPASPIEELLTARERSIARLAAGGATVATIANAHRVAPETVRTHLRAIYRKLDVHSRAELTRCLGVR